MPRSLIKNIARSAVQTGITANRTQFRALASVAPNVSFNSSGNGHKVVVVGGGAAGLAVSHQLLRSGKFVANDIAVVDPSEFHHYQPGWTLVGGGLKTKQELRRPMRDLIDPKLKYYPHGVAELQPDGNTILLSNGSTITYEQLVLAPGIKINLDGIEGLPEALQNSDSPVSSIYTYETCDKVFPNIEKLKKGKAIFTQPTGVVKCAGAPQKIMWLALDHWKKQGMYRPDQPSASPINISFATGLPVMFGVPKYSQALNKVREERNVEGLFEHDLISIKDNVATFKSARSKGFVKRDFDFLHVVPKMGPHAFVKNSPVANEAGFVAVNESTLQHNKFPNIWGLGDASSLPTSKTAAAITAQTPVVVRNLLEALESTTLTNSYDGYTSCPLLTEYGKVMLAEFKYGAEPKETFAFLGLDQATPRRAFYHLKKDFFPWVYYKSMVKGTWGGPKGWTTS